MSGSTESSEFGIPDSTLEGGGDIHAAAHLAAHLTPMPDGKILFPRRMLYVEAVLYMLIAVASFGTGYLVARNGPSKAASADGGDATGEERVPLEGTVVTVEKSGRKPADAGAVVIVLPAGKLLKPLVAVRFSPGKSPAGSDDSAKRELAALGGAMARIGDDGRFQLFVPRPGPYRVLVLSPQGTREFGPLEKSDLKELGNYFDEPSELLQRKPYKWYSKEVHPGMKPIDIEFNE